MIDSKPTTSQVSFINRLREASPEREEAFQKHIREMGKSGVNDLTMQEASRLIDDLKKIRVIHAFVMVNGRDIMRLYCEEDEPFDCIHVQYAWTLPKVQEMYANNVRDGRVNGK
jgi:hypothetical protein